MKLLLLDQFRRNLSSSDAFCLYEGQTIPILMAYNPALGFIADRTIQLADNYLNGTSFIAMPGDSIWLQYNGTLSEDHPSANNFRLHCQSTYHQYTAILNLIPPSAPHGRLRDAYRYDAERQIRNIDAILCGTHETAAQYKQRLASIVESKLPDADFWLDKPASDGRMGLNTSRVVKQGGLYYLSQTFAEGGIDGATLASYMTANAMCIINERDTPVERDKKWSDSYDKNQTQCIEEYYL